jgi:hypothetical protein
MVVASKEPRENVMDQKQDAVEEDSRGRPRAINFASFLLAFLFVWVVFDNLALALLFGLVVGGGSAAAQRAAGKSD